MAQRSWNMVQRFWKLGSFDIRLMFYNYISFAEGMVVETPQARDAFGGPRRGVATDSPVTVAKMGNL